MSEVIRGHRLRARFPDGQLYVNLLDVLVGVGLVQRMAPDRHQLHDLIRLFAASHIYEEDGDPLGRLLEWYLGSATPARGRSNSAASSGRDVVRPTPWSRCPGHTRNSAIWIVRSTWPVEGSSWFARSTSRTPRWRRSSPAVLVQAGILDSASDAREAGEIAERPGQRLVAERAREFLAAREGR